ncbi:MAG: ATP-binding protein [candidate division KSB1 bacterium]|nr:ATP-binding protein [candidate division KSB1 bacterium]
MSVISQKTNDGVQIQIANHLSELERLLAALEEFGEFHLLSAEVLFCARLALEEMITNLLKYGYSDGNEHLIFIRLTLRENKLAIEIKNDADAFNPFEEQASPARKSLHEKAYGGHGLRLVRALMDELHYQRQQGNNILAMEKRLS